MMCEWKKEIESCKVLKTDHKQFFKIHFMTHQSLPIKFLIGMFQLVDDNRHQIAEAVVGVELVPPY